MNQHKPGSRFLRWKILLSEFDFDMIHRPEKSNVVSDCLSRIPHENSEYMEIRYFYYAKNPVAKSISQVTTRKRALENRMLIENEEKKVYEYNVNEEPNTTLNDKKYNRIYFIVDDTKNLILKKLELKIKKTII